MRNLLKLWLVGKLLGRGGGGGSRRRGCGCLGTILLIIVIIIILGMFDIIPLNEWF